ncbi:hypothetical protein [Sphingobacterium mizutaii]|uniref:hypothetical protein n=1 Tax=Sphingobacterium mizutaii TaxID=1010 RepID=UPI00162935FE|nr:hypothetical protein [Sphingobacterium mizutaii]
MGQDLGMNQDAKDERMGQDLGMNQDAKDERMDQDHTGKATRILGDISRTSASYFEHIIGFHWRTVPVPSVNPTLSP